MRRVALPAAVLLLLTAAPPALSATISPGLLPGTVTAGTVGTRYRGPSTGSELYVGVNDLGVGANRNQAEVSWPAGSLAFSFSYDSNSGQLSSTLNGVTSTYASTAGYGADMLWLNLSNRSRRGSDVSLGSLVVNGESVGPVSTAFGTVADFTVSGFAPASVLTVTGTILVGGALHPNEQERVRLQLTANTRDIAGLTPVPGPAGLWLALAGLGALGLLRRPTS